MTILCSVREPLVVASILPRGERERLTLEMMKRVGLGRDSAYRCQHELLGGQKQRVCITRVLTLLPSVIVFDEAVAALYVSIQEDILNLLVDLQREFGMTYILITNNLGVVAHVSGRIAVMYLGSLVEMGEAESLLTRPLRPYTAAFLSSEPVALSSHMRTTQRGILKGELPSPVSPPSGCRFRTRCAFARDLRASQEPEWREVEPATGPPAISSVPCPLSRPRMRRWHQRSSHDKTTGLADWVSPVAGDRGHHPRHDRHFQFSATGAK
jgi:oligopeptide/dipeptide ABC transporter ATP-binding protein